MRYIYIVEGRDLVGNSHILDRMLYMVVHVSIRNQYKPKCSETRLRRLCGLGKLGSKKSFTKTLPDRNANHNSFGVLVAKTGLLWTCQTHTLANTHTHIHHKYIQDVRESPF